MQKTLRAAVSFHGTGLHTGKPVTLTIHPAVGEHGVWFKRTDIDAPDTMIRAHYSNVIQSPLCTKIENAAGVSVSTIEHVMAALAGCGVFNALIEIDGPEVPILDGSAAPFLRGIMARGVRSLTVPARAFEVLKTVRVDHDGARAEIRPSDVMQIDFEIDFADAAIGHQALSLNMSNGSFARELSDSRTFCRQADVLAMQRNGLALGGTPGENAVVFDGDKVISPGGLRYGDEPVRHKMLDALGDLALAGTPIIGHYVGHKAGHALTNMLLRKLFSTPDAVRMILCDTRQTELLPGQGLHWDEIPAVA